MLFYFLIQVIFEFELQWFGSVYFWGVYVILHFIFNIIMGGLISVVIIILYILLYRFTNL